MNLRRIVLCAIILFGLIVAGAAAPKPAPSTAGVSVAGYLVPWDPRSHPPKADVLASLSPVWYSPTPSNGVTFASDDAQKSAATLDPAGTPLMPSISNFRDGRWDGGLIAQIVADPQRRAAHEAAIVNLVRSGRWAGVDIDYESLPASSRANYSAFIKELADDLHRLPAKLSVTVHAKTFEPGDWSGAQAQDWHALGQSADQVRVMAYDFTTANSPPGPIAPAPWVNQVLQLATSLIPVGRIVLGLPTYGYDWTAGSANGQDVQWADVASAASAHAAKSQWDTNSSSPWLRYTDGAGHVHTVWYEDARSLAAKLGIAKQHGVTHVVLWRLGGEDPAIWDALHTPR